jgi:hypothetical protein
LKLYSWLESPCVTQLPSQPGKTEKRYNHHVKPKPNTSIQVASLAEQSRRSSSSHWGNSIGGLTALACLPLVLFLASLCLNRADAGKTKDWQKDQLTYLPSGKLLKPMTLGFEEASASLLWVKGVLYFGEAFLSGGGYQWMGHMLDIVTTLNPRFKEAYNFGSALLTKDKKEIPATLKLIERGLVEYPAEWRWRVSAALAKRKFDSDYVAAAEYLKPVAGDTSVPKHVRLLVATFAEKGGNERMAVAYLVERYLQSTTAIEKEMFSERLAKIDLRDSLNRQVGKPPTAKQRIIRSILDSAQPAQQETVVAVLLEILAGKPSPGVMRLLKSLGESPSSALDPQ